MPEITLSIFDYNYSSWSMRAGVLLRASGLPFQERRLHLDDATRASLHTVSRSRLLPVIEHDGLRVWDSLAIAEYVAELAHALPLWPRDVRARAVARSASAEMHSGFAALRSAMPMNIRARYPGFPRTPAVERDLARIKELWSELRADHGGSGAFLCGELGIVDCMFAPVVMRLRSYGVKLEGSCRDYADAVIAHPAVQDWLTLAQQEEQRVPAYDFVVDD